MGIEGNGSVVLSRLLPCNRSGAVESCARMVAHDADYFMEENE